MSKLERFSAWAMLINGGLGLVVSVGVAILRGAPGGLMESPPYTSILGALCGVLAVRGAAAGLVGGLLFYGLQIISYYSSGFQFSFRSGISLAAVVGLPGGTLVINMAALAGLMVIALILAQRLRLRLAVTAVSWSKPRSRHSCVRLIRSAFKIGCPSSTTEKPCASPPSTSTESPAGCRHCCSGWRKSSPTSPACRS